MNSTNDDEVTTEPENSEPGSSEPESSEPESSEPGTTTTAEPADGDGGLAAVRSWLTTKPVWQVAVAAVLVGAVAAEIFGGLGRAVGVPMEAPPMGGDEAENIPYGAFVMATVFSGVIAVALAAILALKATKPAKLWVVITVVVTVLSFLSPALAEDTTTATKVVLALSHVVAAVVVIPAVALRLAEIEQQRSAPEPAPDPA